MGLVGLVGLVCLVGPLGLVGLASLLGLVGVMVLFLLELFVYRSLVLAVIPFVEKIKNNKNERLIKKLPQHSFGIVQSLIVSFVS